MKIECKYDKLINPKELKLYKKNPNKHPQEQIELFKKCIDFYGWRESIIVSNLSGQVVKGNGRVIASISAGWETIPVVFQNFETEAMEYGYVVSDNALSDYSEQEIDMIKETMIDYPELDIELLAVQELKTEDFEPSTIEEQGKLDEKIKVYMECPHCGEKFEKSEAKIID